MLMVRALALVCAAAASAAVPAHLQALEGGLLARLTQIADFTMTLQLRTNHPPMIGKPPLDDRGNYVTGNLARTLFAAYQLTNNRTYLDEALAWCDTFADEQNTNFMTPQGNPAGCWTSEIYFADTGTGVQALAYCVHMADDAGKAASYTAALERYAALILNGTTVSPDKATNRPPSWKPIGTEAHPSSWIYADGLDKGSLGDGWWNGTLNEAPYTVSTATTAAFFSALYGINKRSEYHDAAQNALAWLVKWRGDHGEPIYCFNGKANVVHHTSPYWNARVWVATYPAEGEIAADIELPNVRHLTRQLNSTAHWIAGMQEANGSMGVPGTADGERSPRVVSLLQWYSERVGECDACDAAVQRWAEYIVSDHGLQETLALTYPLPASFVGLTIADLLQFGITFRPGHAAIDSAHDPHTAASV